MISKDLLKILACPLCKTNVILKNGYLVCEECGRKYPIKDEIPIMLIEEASIDEKISKK